jgi:hypothetical protein
MPLFFLDRSIHLLPYALPYDQTMMQHEHMGPAEDNIQRRAGLEGILEIWLSLALHNLCGAGWCLLEAITYGRDKGYVAREGAWSSGWTLLGDPMEIKVDSLFLQTRWHHFGRITLSMPSMKLLDMPWNMSTGATSRISVRLAVVRLAALYSTSHKTKLPIHKYNAHIG